MGFLGKCRTSISLPKCRSEFHKMRARRRELTEVESTAICTRGHRGVEFCDQGIASGWTDSGTGPRRLRELATLPGNYGKQTPSREREAVRERSDGPIQSKAVRLRGQDLRSELYL